MANDQSSTPTGSGIYLIRCLVNGKVYVGSATDLVNRWCKHRGQLIAAKHTNRYLQASWDKHGAHNFSWEVLEHVEIDRLIEREQYHIDRFQSANRAHGYNLSPTAQSTLGVKFTIEAKAKIAAKARGRIASAESRAKQSAARKGNKHGLGKSPSAETRAKISAAGKGIKRSVETKARLSEANKRKWENPEYRAKMLGVLQNAHKDYVHTAETCAKISAATKGKKKSVETRARMSAAQKGRKRSTETKARISETKRRRHHQKNKPSKHQATFKFD
jgi:group I intron endonuclease